MTRPPKVLALQLPDGRTLKSDRPSREVQEAALRVRRTLEDPRRPGPPGLADIRLLLRWLEEQDRRHGGFQ